MTDKELTSIHEWAQDINKKPIAKPQPDHGPVYKVKCKNCGHLHVFKPDEQAASVCPCGSCIVRLTDDGKSYEIYYSSHNII